MPSYTNLESLLRQAAHGAHPGGLNIALGDGSVRYGHDLPDIAAAIARSHPAGVDAVIIGQAGRAGWSPATQFHSGAHGIIAILIGLLLPAVQKVREAAQRMPSAGGPTQVALGTLQRCLKPGGRLLVLDGNGRWLTWA